MPSSTSAPKQSNPETINKAKATPVGFFLSMIFSLSGIAYTGDEAARPSGCPDEKLH
ncbi:hypothetical protein HMPREF0578_1906 [Mobiluncus mulieris 28-1]|uniref:Uncharacterized protein n=1 Tax=Mobiluncus mulieris ATCC 35239 TaxID=871571 RepID=E0QSH9_9ACTO|nr:hypothetical protein HMPREF0578_1906 [Mobiluncus mulieris 28-1]EFM45554.1 hypothetical protein HMPREF0580_1844 [Mobiluncus mulieris ATCC 35239]EFN93702.1 hypothetical protein HMPREF9278_0867 [Mobiluncus mulieris FB024-16]